MRRATLATKGAARRDTGSTVALDDDPGPGDHDDTDDGLLTSTKTSQPELTGLA